MVKAEVMVDLRERLRLNHQSLVDGLFWDVNSSLLHAYPPPHLYIKGTVPLHSHWTRNVASEVWESTLVSFNDDGNVSLTLTGTFNSLNITKP